MKFLDSVLTNQYTESLTILSLTLAVVIILRFLLKKYCEKVAKKTETELDDIILNLVRNPLLIIIIFAGVSSSLLVLDIFKPFYGLISGIYYSIAVLTLAYMVTSIANMLVARWFKINRRTEKTPELITKIIAILIYVIAILTIFDHFDIKLSPILATLGIGGLAIGLALQDTMKDFFAGLHIISDKPIRVGDFIELEGEIVLKGNVQDISWRSTRIKTLLNNIIVLPNSKLAASTIINFNMPRQESVFLLKCGVAYTSDLDKVEKIALDVARKVQKKVEGAIADYEPKIRFSEFGDSNINFKIIMKVKKYPNKYRVRHELIKALKKRFDKEKIEISWPVRKMVK